MKWSVGTKVGAGYAVALVILVALGLFAYRDTTDMIKSVYWRVHTYKVLDNVQSLVSALKDAETGQRGFLLVGDAAYLQPYQNALGVIDSKMNILRQLTADNPAQQARLNQIQSLIVRKLAELKKTIDLQKKDRFKAALKIVQTNKGKEYMDEIRRIASDMRHEELTLLKQRDGKEMARRHSTLSVIVYGIPAAFAAVLLVGFMIVRAITTQIRGSIAQLSATSSQILTTTAQASASSAETSTALSETTATVEEVKQTVQLSNQKSQYVSESAQKMTQISQDGRKSVEETVQEMQRIQAQMESVAESIVRLSEQSQDIGEIIATVNDLAEQSNLLAVNAAIEATKAGEQGKGFVVVAQEVKSLAEQSKQATGQVRTILSDIQKATSAAVLAAEQGAKAVGEGVKKSAVADDAIRILSESIGEAAQAATQIAVSSQQQMVGMDQIAQAMENIKQAGLQNVEGTKQAELAAQSLHELGQQLSAMVGGRAV